MRVPPKCPKCGDQLREILYGLIRQPPEDKQNYVLGGCIMDEDPADYRCLTCEQDFHEDDVPGFSTGTQ